MVGCPLNLKIDFANDIYFGCKVKAQPLMPFAEPCGAKKRIRLSRAILVAKGGQVMILSCRPPRGQYAARRCLVAVNMFSKI